MPCAAPSEVVLTPTAKAIGLLAEDFIGEEYLRHRGRSTFFPASPEDFQDVSVIFGNRQLHVAFLAANNPTRFKPGVAGLGFDLADPLAVDANRMKVPDLLNHIPAASTTPSRVEYYEIKPNSISGRSAGRRKLKSLESDYKKLAFPYIRGKVWSVNKRVRIFKGSILGFSVESTFHYFLLEDGLIVYDICIDGPLLKFVALAVIIGIIAAIITIIINRGRIPDIPPPKPPELPLPKPAPIPIPRPPVPVPAFQQKASARVPVILSEDVTSLLPSFSIIKGSVGVGGANRSADVILVQLLLNDWCANTNQEILAIDGLFGPKTNATIHSFQQVYTVVQDGRIDPNGPTLKALLAVHLGSLFRSIEQNPLLYLRGKAWQQIITSTPAALLADYFAILSGKSCSMEFTNG